MKIKKNLLDSYYTPSALANHLISFVRQENIVSAVDFCVGNGDLLKVVAERFDKTKLYGADISSEVILSLKTKFKNWRLDVCDFKDDNQINLLSFSNELNFDLIVLNPPFSCKASSVEAIILDGKEFKVSPAMFFVIKALRYLSKKGGIYAILPISCVYSNKDKKAWTYLQENYNACILDEPKKVSFSNSCSPNIVLIYVGRYFYKHNGKLINQISVRLPIVDIIRGNVQMNKINHIESNNDGVFLIHTTNIRDGKLCNLIRISKNINNKVKCYGVVIPRVCNPNRGKVALIDGRYSYALSECVILLKTLTREDAICVKKAILTNWVLFASLYKGTGARYTTLEKLREYFQLEIPILM